MKVDLTASAGVPEVTHLHPVATFVSARWLPTVLGLAPLTLALSLSAPGNLTQDSSFVSKGGRICSHLLAKGIFGERVLFLSPGSYSNRTQEPATFVIPKKPGRPGPGLRYCYYSALRRKTLRHRGAPPPKVTHSQYVSPSPDSLMQGPMPFPGPAPPPLPPTLGTKGIWEPHSLKYLMPLFKHLYNSVMATMTIK